MKNIKNNKKTIVFCAAAAVLSAAVSYGISYFGGAFVQSRFPAGVIAAEGERYLYTLLYVFAFALVLVRMLCGQSRLQKERLDTVIIFYTLFLFTFTFTYYEDTKMIYENARVMKSAIKHGEFFHYYDYAFIQSKYRMNANYNVMLYFIYIICFLPYDIANKIVGDVPLYYGHIWYNFIVCLVYMFTAHQVKRLLKIWNIPEKTADLIGILYFMNPILLFTTVGMSQLEIFYIAVFLEGLIMFEKGKTDKACLVWSVSVAMKMFPVLVVIPLLLLREKKLLKLARYVAEVMGLSLVFHLIYGNSEGWVENQLYNPHYRKLFADLFPAQTGSAAVFLVVYLLILFICWAYKGKEDFKITLLCGLAVYTAFLCFCGWNPQYIAMTGLFLVLAALLAKEPYLYLGIETFLSLGYILTVWYHFGDVNNTMVLCGIVGGFRFIDTLPVLFSEFVSVITTFEHTEEAAVSISTAAGLFLVAYCLYSVWKRKEDLPDGKSLKSLKAATGSPKQSLGAEKEDKIDGSAWDFPVGYLYLPMLPVYAMLLLSGILSFSS
ncbi:MAG: hypothetical protein IKQ27_10705 [Lachnospiraceae bacterium]|nr:hypothetical protein [Lachnospiraceae bacterium]